MEDASASAYAQLLFAPIDASVPDDSPLLPSGFRVMHLEVCPVSGYFVHGFGVACYLISLF